MSELTRRQRHDAKRLLTQPWRAFYKTNTWQTIRIQQLQANPLCKRCTDHGQVTAATVVHHVNPHKGDWQLFTQGPFESLCKRCHDSDEQQIERRGYSTEIGLDGWPVDDTHPRNENAKQRRSLG